MPSKDRAESRSGRAIVLAHQTFIDIPPPRFVEVAAEAGYDGVSLRLLPARPGAGEPPYPMLGPNAPMMRETLAALAGTGVRVQSLEVVRIKPELDIGTLDSLMDAGAMLGAKSINVVSDDSDEARVADKLGALAEMAAGRGLDLGFEFIVYTGVRTVAQAMRVLQASGSDAKLLVDALHLHRSGGAPADLVGVPPQRIVALQVCDAMRAPLPDSGGVAFEGVSHRLLPSQGELPLLELIQAVPTHADLEVEAPTKAMRATHTVAEIARMAIDATRQLMRRVDSTS